jgi:1,4-alpha-glucan branching enzyme
MQIIKDLPYLERYRGDIDNRYNNFLKAKKGIESIFGSLSDFADSYKTYDLHKVEKGISYKEWAPNAKELFLVGDFNDWGKSGKLYPAKKDESGTFSLFIPDKNDGTSLIPHNSKVKCLLVLDDGRILTETEHGLII